MNEMECETCIKRKTMYCPNSSECFETKDKPYYQNRIMLLEENKQLKKTNENTTKIYLNTSKYCSECETKIITLEYNRDEAIKIIDEYAMTEDYISLECKDLADVFIKIKETLQGKKGE